ncbi:MAG: sigma-54-dependent transcriptional regulator [Bacteroidota bacterium]
MRGETILIIDDEKLIRWSLKQELLKEGYNVLEAETVQSGLNFIQEYEPDLILLDQRLPDGTGIEILANMSKNQSISPVIMLTAFDRSDIAVQAMKLGAFDYVTKPVNIEELKIVIDKGLESTHLKRQIAQLLKSQKKEYGFCGLIGSSPVMKRVYYDISKIAQSSNTTVLITGESGTGKELAAQAIHFLSDRKDKPLMAVNCSALSESLIESELFGHEKGSFTDARSQKKGIFELSDRGSILLDEIGDITPRLQVKLLRVLEQKTFQRVGGRTDITVDVRIIAATNQSLEKRIAEEKFRPDLYYRLNVINLHMPPLSERGEDIIYLSEYFLQELNSKFHKHFKGIAPETRRILTNYTWPGNVRELRNVLERAVLLSEGEYIEPMHIEFSRLPGYKQPPTSTPEEPTHGDSLFEIEKKTLIHALEKTNYNQTKAAKLLQISRDTLRYRMKKYNISAGET